MISNREYQGQQKRQGTTSPVSDFLAVEVPLEIQLNGKAFSTTMCTPSQMNELVTGLLFTEGLIGAGADEIMVEIQFNTNKQKHIAIAKTKEPIPKNKIGSRELLSVTSCGICGNTHFEKPIGKLERSLTKETAVEVWFQKMEQKQSEFQKTGGTHAAALFNEQNDMIAMGQDIGRHNAVDKAVGQAHKNGTLETAIGITVSGRLSYEILAKAFKAKIPQVCSVSAPSSLAVDVAKEWGITLSAFCRENRYTTYS
ncbi:MAG: formate dehydrogenase accessory sulfurtransferase FdhD [Bacteroidota bacterium]